MAAIEPRFQHDCEDCVFIGHYEGHDIYRCPQELAPWPTIVARWGDDGPEYTSGRIVMLGDMTLSLHPEWEVAQRQAHERASERL